MYKIHVCPTFTLLRLVGGSPSFNTSHALRMLTFNPLNILLELSGGQYGVDHLLDQTLAPELPGKIIIDGLLSDLVDVGVSGGV